MTRSSESNAQLGVLTARSSKQYDGDETHMNSDNTALILIGYQNDYFAEDGILRGAIEESVRTNRILENTDRLLDAVVDTSITIIDTPIHFTDDYGELINPVGILKVIKDVGAFKVDTKGSETIHNIDRLGARRMTVPGKRGLNAFSNTDLDMVLSTKRIENVVLAGAVTSICIDSTARAAHERGMNVTILTDCTAARTNFEQQFYCENIFPLYASPVSSSDFLGSLEG